MVVVDIVAAVELDMAAVAVVVVVARFAVPHFPANKIPYGNEIERERESRQNDE